MAQNQGHFPYFASHGHTLQGPVVTRLGPGPSFRWLRVKFPLDWKPGVLRAELPEFPVSTPLQTPKFPEFPQFPHLSRPSNFQKEFLETWARAKYAHTACEGPPRGVERRIKRSFSANDEARVPNATPAFTGAGRNLFTGRACRNEHLGAAQAKARKAGRRAPGRQSAV